MRGVLRKPLPATGRVLLLIALMTSVALLMWTTGVRGQHGSLHHPSLPWWLLAAMFGVTELCVLHLQVRREAQTVSLSEIPLLLALFFASPPALLLGWLVGPGLVFVLHRRQAPVKVAFNLCLLLLQGCVALGLFRLLHGAGDQLGVRAVLAAYATVLVSGALSATATTAAIALYEGSIRLRELATETGSAAAASTLVGSVALVATYALSAGAFAAVPLVASVAVLLACYRTYATLSERHSHLQQLFRFSQVLTRNPDVDDVLRRLLVEARQLLRAEWVDVVVCSPDLTPRLEVALGRDGEIVRRPVSAGSLLPAAHASALASGEAVLLSRRTRDDEHREYLERRGVRDAIVAPMHGDDGMIGIITVADRLGDVRGFDADDVRLLATVANHASVALQNSQLVDRLRHESLHDGLTGLPNREFLQQRLRALILELDAGVSAGFAVMILDLNGFKDVNDTLGHQLGDVLLRDVAQRLRGAVREGVLVARLGGDEFAIVTPGVVGTEAATRVAGELQHALDTRVVLDGTALTLSAAVGVALAPDHAADATELLKRADIAMYAAKRSASGLHVYSAHSDHTSPDRLAMAEALRTGIEQGQLELLVQPQMALASGTVAAVEALVRWRHPTRGLLTPDTFMDQVESGGLIRPLTSEVLRLAVDACAAWHRSGLELGIAVNLSARCLTDHHVADEVAELLHRADLPPHLLTLEITESSIMTNLQETVGLLARFEQMGVRLSVDDFGTGYSSLAYLRRLPVHEMKVDRGFVTGMCDDPENHAIVRTIVALGGSLGLHVVAEGVEDQRTQEALTSMGCTLIQGYHLSRPMPVDELPGWLRQHAARRTPTAGPVFAVA